MALSDKKLNEKLRQYLVKFAQEWTFDRVSQLGTEGHNVYEHDDDPTHPDFVQVHFQLLERVVENGKDYLFAAVDISDNRRGFGKGSAYRSLCGGMFFHADGRIEVHIPKEADGL